MEYRYYINQDGRIIRVRGNAQGPKDWTLMDNGEGQAERAYAKQIADSETALNKKIEAAGASRKAKLDQLGNQLAAAGVDKTLFMEVFG